MRYVAEYVLPGHPDKLCDAIADALVEEAGSRERRALCGVEVAVHRASVFVTGRIACKGAQDIDIEGIVRSVYSSAGYGGKWQPDPSDLKVGLDLCLGPLNEGEDEFRGVADDQSILTGYAIDLRGTNFLPPEHWLAWRLALRMEQLRGERPELSLGPDGKLIVVYEEKDGVSHVTAFSASLQQSIRGPAIDLHRAVRELLSEELGRAAERIPGFTPEIPERICVNGAGNFAVGGPEGDNGLSGKKLVVDAYGPRVPIGGGALSGKDFFKVDRAGALIARRIAKAVVQTGVVKECTAKLGIFPGDETFSIVSLTEGNGATVDPERWSPMFNLALASAGDRYTGSANLVQVARHGHFTDAGFPWERVRFDDSQN
jgi:S-adenosylmethionine synthetase